MNTVARTRYRHWRIEIADTQALLTLDVAGQSANTLSREVLAELEQILAELAPQYLRGLILRSAKPGGFIAGADVREFEKITDAQQATELARNAQRAFTHLAALPFPSVALIHGYCLGGGLELALACTYRVARDDTATRLGLPEVRLGIHPGFAGTLRLPALIGDLPALDLMLSGRSVSAREARRWGLVDEVVPERHLLHAAQALLHRHAPRRQAPWYRRLAAWRPLRPWVARVLRARLSKKAPPQHYPAPHRLLELWQHRATAEQEAQSLGELLVSPTGRNLTQLFLQGEALKRATRAEPVHRDVQGGTSAAGDRMSGAAIEWVHVIGAGTMGADIALWAAQRGFRVSLQDRHPEALARALKRAHEFFKKRQREPRAVQEAMDRLMPDLAGNGLKRADLVIEAIVEDLDAKQALFREIEQKIKPQALLATNTSSIPLEDLGKALADPARLVGLHFFNPVAKMQLIEIVRGALTSEAALARARAFAVALDRLPLDVASRPGFLVNRVLMPYLLEAVRMVEEGISPPRVDAAACDFGMPIGPIELADTVGLDICLAVAERLGVTFKLEVPASLRTHVAHKRLGKKSGEGFYKYNARGRPPRSWRSPAPEPALAERLILRLLNEAMACLREGVVQNATAVDLGLVYGAGFAPFRGGPLCHAHSLGEQQLHHSLYRLAAQHGAGFNPDSGWTQLGLWQGVT